MSKTVKQRPASKHRHHMGHEAGRNFYTSQYDKRRSSHYGAQRTQVGGGVPTSMSTASESIQPMHDSFDELGDGESEYLERNRAHPLQSMF